MEHKFKTLEEVTQAYPLGREDVMVNKAEVINRHNHKAIEYYLNKKTPILSSDENYITFDTSYSKNIYKCVGYYFDGEYFYAVADFEGCIIL